MTRIGWRTVALIIVVVGVGLVALLAAGGELAMLSILVGNGPTR